MAFNLAAIVFARRGRYPRTDGSGAGLMGMILTAIAGALFFMRLFAIAAGRP